MTHICVMSVFLFFHKSIRIYMEVIILGANTLYSVFCFFKALLPKQVWSGMVGKGLSKFVCSCIIWSSTMLVFVHVSITAQGDYIVDM